MMCHWHRLLAISASLILVLGILGLLCYGWRRA